jgi:hypothetical protein
MLDDMLCGEIELGTRGDDERGARGRGTYH